MYMRQIQFCIMFIAICFFANANLVKMDVDPSTEINFTVPNKVLMDNQPDQPDDGIRALCYQNNTGGVLPCDKNNINSSAACFLPQYGIIKCKDLSPAIPICVQPHFNQQSVVSCDEPGKYLCFTKSLKAMEFCTSSLHKVCLSGENTVQPCSGSRFKRQEEPQLDLDGYYAACEDCKISLQMTLDEETHAQPVIEIRSEALDLKEKNKTISDVTEQV